MVIPTRLSVMLLMVSFTSCISPKPITEVSTKAGQSLDIYPELRSYTDFCQQRCRFQERIEQKIVRDSSEPCECKLQLAADKATRQVHNLLTAYFKSLGALSKGDLTDINTRKVTDALNDLSTSTSEVDKKIATAYSSLGKLMIKVFTEGYRRKKLNEVIGQANAPLQTLLSVFQTSSENLRLTLSSMKERMFLHYSDLAKDQNLDRVRKAMLVREYQHELDAVNMQQEQLLVFSKSLSTIAKGHQRLFENRDKLSGREIRFILAEYSLELQELLADFRKIKS